MFYPIGYQHFWFTTKSSKSILITNTLPPCGQICELNGEEQRGRNNHYKQLTKKVNCENILGRMVWENYPVVRHPPRKPPTALLAAFTQNGKVPITKYRYFNDVIPKERFEWPEEMFQHILKLDQQQKTIAAYGGAVTFSNTIKSYTNELSGKEGVVIGTIRPWVEASFLNAGAKELTTLEYSNLTIDHPLIKVEHPSRIGQEFLNNRAQYFDFGGSFSSLEHSGLGRFGDPLNPYGDFEAMAQVWCMLKPGGLFFLGIPVSKDNSSYIHWNGQRVYGGARLPHLTANWRLIQRKKCPDMHAIFVLRKN